MAPRRKVVATSAKKPSTRRSSVTAAPYVAPLFVGNSFDADAVAAHHDAVASASWLRGVATVSAAVPPSAKLRVLCVLPDVEVDAKVLDKIDELIDADDDEFHGPTLTSVALLRQRRLCAELKLHERLMAYIGASSLCEAIHLDHDGSERISDIDFSDLSDADMVLIGSYDIVFVDADTSYHRTLVAALGDRCVVVSSKPRGRQIAATVTALLRRIGDEVELRRLQTTMPWAPPLPTVPAPSYDDATVDAMSS